MTATRLASTGGGTGTYAGVYDVTATAYGATTAATDNTAAINAAISAAKTNGGTVYVPPGIYKYSGQLNLDQNSRGWRFCGASGTGEIGTPHSELQYTGSGATPAISAHSIFGVEIDHLRFTYDNSGGNFTGDLLDIDGNPHLADCTNWSIHDCGFKHLAAITARSMVRLNKAINGRIVDNGMAGAVNTLRIGDPGGAYVVNLKVGGNTWNFASDAHILIASGDAEKIIIDDANSFEAGTNTTAIRGATTAVDGGNSLCYGLEIADNWYGDAGASTDWIKGLRVKANGFVVVRGNFFGEAGVTGTHLGTDTSGANSILSIGNHYLGGNNVFNLNTNSTMVSIGDLIDGSTNLFNGDRPLNTSIIPGHAAGATVANTPYATLPPRVALGIGAAISNFPGDALDAGPTGDQEQLVLGAYSGTAPKALGPKAAVYTRVKGGDPGVLIVQAASTDNTHEVQLVAGITPTPVVRVSNAAVGWFNTAPVVQQAGTGTATGFVAGAGTAVTDQSTFTGAVGTTAYRISDIVKALKNYGLLAS